MECTPARSLPKDHKPPRLIRKDEVRLRFGNPPASSFYRMIEDGIIPPAIHINGGRTSFWIESEIDKALAGILAEAGREVAV